MSTAPILNVSNMLNSPVVAKTSSSDNNSSDQSFGQVLSREVNGRSSANGDANNNQSNTGTTGSTSTSASNTGSKPVKAKSGDSSSQTTDSSSGTTTGTVTTSQSESAQMLALVSSVQQSTPVLPDGTAASSNAAAIVGVDKLAIGVGAGANLPTTSTAALLPSTIANSDAASTAANAIVNAPISDAAQIAADMAIKPALSTNASITLKVNNAISDTSNIELSPKNPDASLSPINSGNQVALDLSATAEKNIQSGLAMLNANSIKSEHDIQTTPVIATPINAAQTLATGQVLANDPNDRLTPQVGSAGWDQAVGQKVVWMIAGGQQNASLTLNPPDLGPMQVVLNVNNSHATVTFTSSQPEVRQALESAIPKLREMLGDAGIQLGQASINSGSAQQQQTFSQQNGHGVNPSGNNNDSADISIAIPRTVAISTGLGLVDTFA